MHEDLKAQLKQLETNYDGDSFWNVVRRVKKERINDEELLNIIEKISIQRFRKNVSFTIDPLAGNLSGIIITIAAIVLVFRINSEWMLYVSALILMATLHPLSHYMTGSLAGIRFTHYYLDGPARIEPTLRIDYSSYLKASGVRRSLMHVSGVIGTVAAPLVMALIALSRDADSAAFNLVLLFLGLIVFEMLTSAKVGDLMRAKREYGYK